MQQKQEEERKKTGRTTIDNPARTRSFSMRAKKNIITVIRKHCPYCHHHKAFDKPKGIYCTRCGKKQ